MTLGKKFKALREDRSYSLAGVAMAAGLHRTTVWRIEKGEPHAINILERCAIKGLGLSKTSPEWSELRNLWAAQTTKKSAKEIGAEMEPLRMVHEGAMATFLEAVSALSPSRFQELAKAVVRPVVMDGLAALNAAYDAGQSRKKKG